MCTVMALLGHWVVYWLLLLPWETVGEALAGDLPGWWGRRTHHSATLRGSWQWSVAVVVWRRRRPGSDPLPPLPFPLCTGLLPVSGPEAASSLIHFPATSRLTFKNHPPLLSPV